MTTSLRELPLFAALADSRRILIAGAGGGFDVFANAMNSGNVFTGSAGSTTRMNGDFA